MKTIFQVCSITVGLLVTQITTAIVLLAICTGCSMSPPYIITRKIHTQSYTNTTEFLGVNGTKEKTETIYPETFTFQYSNPNQISYAYTNVSKEIWLQYQIGDDFNPTQLLYYALPEEQEPP